MNQRDQDYYRAGKLGMHVQFETQQDRDFYEAGRRGLELSFGNVPQGHNSDAAQNGTGFLDAAYTTVKEGATAAKSLATGEGKAEFPDMPELTEAPVGFGESFVPNLKLGLTMDPGEKARIVADSFGDDPRFGGIFRDNQGNPIVEWEGQPYYVNRPGFSQQDATDVVAQATQFLPAAKVAGAARTVGGKLLAGIPLYGATDLAQQAGSVLAGGKDTLDAEQATATGVIGGVAEAVMPPLMKAGSRVARGLRSAKSPTLNPGSSGARDLHQRANLALTEGQRTGNMNILRKEEAARQGAYGQTASDVMRGFDDRQMVAIQGQADDIQKTMGRGSGFSTDTPTDIGERLQRGLIGEAANRKSAVSAAYDAAAEASISRPARLNREGVLGIAEDILAVPKDMNIIPAQLDQMPKLKLAIDRAREVRKMAQRPNYRPVNFQVLEANRKALNNLWRDAPKGSTEELALRKVIDKVDDWTEKSITNGLLDGDPTTIDTIKNARGLARDYHRLFSKGKGRDPAGSTMVKILDETQATPLQTINYLIGVGKTQSTPQSLGLIRRIKSVFGPDSDEVGLLKDAFLMKAFSGVHQGQRQVTRGDLVRGALNLINGDGKTLAKELFTPAERRRISQLALEVSKTITPQDARNPSRSAWAVMQLMRDHNLLSMAGKATKAVPLLSEAGKGLEEVGGAMTARNLTSQAERLTSIPLVDAGFAAKALKIYDAASRERQRKQQPVAQVVPMPRLKTQPPETQEERLARALKGRPTAVTSPSPLADALMGRKR